ncbi:MAG: sulfite exporter TauE/SafE family protein [Pseudomonadales bacterium]|jgi:uncharacterized membrane protein YfcA
MDSLALTLFLAVACVGAYVQAVTGFAMGLLMMAVMAASGWVAIPVTAAAVGLLALTNILWSLKGHQHEISQRLLGVLALSVAPAVGTGVWVLGLLDRHQERLLEGLFALFIILGSLSMLWKPRVLKQPSGSLATFCAGFAGGVLGGLFAASGPVLGWFMYRQPLPTGVARATLLAFFALASSTRLLLVGVSGGLTRTVWLSAGMALPLVLLGTWLGRRFSPSIGDAAMRRAAFGLLLLIGTWMLIHAVFLRDL